MLKYFVQFDNITYFHVFNFGTKKLISGLDIATNHCNGRCKVRTEVTVSNAILYSLLDEKLIFCKLYCVYGARITFLTDNC